MEVCTVSGMRATEFCRAAGTTTYDYFMEKYAPRLPCDLHLLPEPDPDELEEDPEEEGEESEEPDEEDPDPGEDPQDEDGEQGTPPDEGDNDEIPPGDDDENGPDGQGGAGNEPGEWWENFLGSDWRSNLNFGRLSCIKFLMHSIF